MDFYKGDLRKLYIQVNQNWVAIGCLTDNTFSEDAEMLQTTTRDTPDGWSSSIPTRQSFTISFSGVMTQNNNSGDINSYEDLKLIKRNRVNFSWRIDSIEGGVIESGSGHITSLSETSTVESFVTFTGEIEGNGLPLSTNLPPSITNKWIEIGDSWVYKGANINEFQIEVGDMIRRYPSLNRYIHGRVNLLPYTDENNLSLFEDIQII